MSSFETVIEAQTYMRSRVDVPISERRETINKGLTFHAFPEKLDDSSFTNVYDISYRAGSVVPTVRAYDRLTSVYDTAQQEPNIPVISSAGFFFLADRVNALPRQLALNLTVAGGRIRGLPVVDRETVISNRGRLLAEPVRALGMLSINGRELSWAGSLTTHEADCKIFGNGNSVIVHERNEVTGSVRVLDERSRFTPAIDEDDIVDIGFISKKEGIFKGVSHSTTGNLDIFAHDVVVRCHEKYLACATEPEMVVRTIGRHTVGTALEGAFSAGPMLTEKDFGGHPINKDASLGGKPPFFERPLARMALYETDEGMVHLRLFDGRPGSETFPGVTPGQAATIIREENNIAWGCFLDPGQTAKLCIRNGEYIESLGNTHYLRWATKPGEKYSWTPEAGRPVASMIALQ